MFINVKEQILTLLMMLFDADADAHSGSMLLSVGFSARETACYLIYCDLTHFLLVMLFTLFFLKMPVMNLQYHVIRVVKATSLVLTACTT